MSKSKPETCIYMHDTEEDIKRKLSKAYCPEKIIDGNPIFDYLKFLVFKKYDSIKIERPSKFGGDINVSYDELTKIYSNGSLHPTDLKNTAAVYLNEMIKPVREYFEKNKKAKELYEEVKSYSITR